MGKANDIEADLAAIGQRNGERAVAVIAQMGIKYACHPANVIHKDPVRARFMPADQVAAPRVPQVLLLRRKGGE